MRHIDLESWPRREHFNMFSTFDYPHFSMCANVDLTIFYPAVKQHNTSFTISTVYVFARAANAISQFRQRIRGREVIEHEIVHPSTTFLTDQELFSFCTIDYAEDFWPFAAKAAAQIAYLKEHPSLENEPGRDDLLYMTPIPWVSFTSFMHPIHMHPVDSVPRFAWGKLFEDGESLKMPLSVQGHHALMDGVHVGRFYAQVQSYLNQPDSILAKV